VSKQGFYYSFYKTLITAPSLVQGLRLLISDNVTEYPSTINTLRRFNLYPEASWLRWHIFMMTAVATDICHAIHMSHIVLSHFATPEF